MAMKLQTSALTAATVMLYLNHTPALSAVTAQPDAKPTTIVGCLVHGLPSNTEGRTATATGATSDYFVRTPTVKFLQEPLLP